MKIIANHGPVSIEAHTDAMQILADQSVTVTSTTDRIDVLAKDKLVLQAGQSTITLDGSNITIACPGNFTVKSGQHNWLGGEGQTAELPVLPPMLIALPATPNKTPTLSSQPCAYALPAYKEDNHTESRDCADYYETNANGLATIAPKTGQPILLNFASGTGTYDLAYDPKATTLTATLKIKIVPKEWQKIGPDGKVVTGKDGKPITLPYDSDLAQKSGYLFKEIHAIDLSAGTDTFKSHIEGILNQHHFKLTQKACLKGGACKCQVSIKLKVEFVTDGTSHATINLFKTCVRANAANWGITQVVRSAKSTSGYAAIETQNAPVHEAGHLYAWPDEYFLDGGAVYNKYITAQKLVDVKMANLVNDWQRETNTNLMGSGMNGTYLSRFGCPNLRTFSRATARG